MFKFFNAGNYDPIVATDGAAGFDLSANEVVTGVDYMTVKTGIHAEIPTGWVGLLVPRSSWGSQGWSLANTVGVIDSDYRGEIILRAKRDVSKGWATISEGDRIAQLVLVRSTNSSQKVASLSDLSETDRGDGGFGSTGGA
tara:strand:- start:15 stop:437 length:423 start_codon:yes stop_codon:yes gene_type:complete